MSEARSESREMIVVARADGAGTTLLDHASAIRRSRTLIIVLLLVAVAGAAIYSVLAPPLYEGTASLLSPKEDSGSSMMSGLLASGLVSSLGLASSSTPNRDLLIGVLKSRTIAEAVVTRFALQERYRKKFAEDAVKKLQKDMSRVDVGKDGIIVLTLWDWDAKLAADMANHWLDVADRIVAKYGTSEAGRQRAFITDQLARSRENLAKAEEALRVFQERNRAIVLQDQTRGAIEAAARLKGEVVASEVQLQVLRSFATDANPEVAALKQRISEMKRQLIAVQYGDKAPVATRDFHVPFVRVPEVGLDLIRLTRDVKVEETVVGLLTQQLEQSRITEAKDLPIVQVLDPAIPAARPSRPRPLLNIAVAALGGLLIGVGIALTRGHVTRLRVAAAVVR